MVIEALQPTEVRKLTLDDVLHMVDAGIIEDWERVELVDGVLVTMSPEGVGHASTIIRLSRLFMEVYAAPLEVRINLTWPLSGPHHFRVPDLLVTQPIGERWPEPHEAILAVEVAQTSLARDLGAKAAEYARWGAPTYWVLDLAAQELVTHERPVGGRYQMVARRSGSDELVFPGTDRRMGVQELFHAPTPG